MANCLREAGIGASNPLTPTSVSAETLFVDFVLHPVSLLDTPYGQALPGVGSD